MVPSFIRPSFPTIYQVIAEKRLFEELKNTVLVLKEDLQKKTIEMQALNYSNAELRVEAEGAKKRKLDDGESDSKIGNLEKEIQEVKANHDRDKTALENSINEAKNMHSEDINQVKSIQRLDKTALENSINEAKRVHSEDKSTLVNTINQVKSIQRMDKTELRNNIDSVIVMQSRDKTTLQNTINVVKNNVMTTFENELNQVKIAHGRDNSILQSQHTSMKKYVRNVQNECNEQIDNIHGVLFSHCSTQVNDVIEGLELRWVMQGYAKKFQAETPVIESPVFHIDVDGYRLKLAVVWNGENREKLGLFLYLIRGDDASLHEHLEPFNREIVMAITNKTGCRVERKLTYELIEQHKDFFTIEDGKKEAKKGGFGDAVMVIAPYDDFVINDALHLSCIILSGQRPMPLPYHILELSY